MANFGACDCSHLHAPCKMRAENMFAEERDRTPDAQLDQEADQAVHKSPREPLGGERESVEIQMQAWKFSSGRRPQRTLDETLVARQARLSELQRLAKERKQLEAQLAQVKSLIRVVTKGKVCWKAIVAGMLSAQSHRPEGKIGLRRRVRRRPCSAPSASPTHNIPAAAEVDHESRDKCQGAEESSRRKRCCDNDFVREAIPASNCCGRQRRGSGYKHEEDSANREHTVSHVSGRGGSPQQYSQRLDIGASEEAYSPALEGEHMSRLERFDEPRSARSRNLVATHSTPTSHRLKTKADDALARVAYPATGSRHVQALKEGSRERTVAPSRPLTTHHSDAYRKHPDSCGHAETGLTKDVGGERACGKADVETVGDGRMGTLASALRAKASTACAPRVAHRSENFDDGYEDDFDVLTPVHSYVPDFDPPDDGSIIHDDSCAAEETDRMCMQSRGPWPRNACTGKSQDAKGYPSAPLTSLRDSLGSIESRRDKFQALQGESRQTHPSPRDKSSDDSNSSRWHEDTSECRGAFELRDSVERDTHRDRERSTCIESGRDGNERTITLYSATSWGSAHTWAGAQEGCSACHADRQGDASFISPSVGRERHRSSSDVETTIPRHAGEHASVTLGREDAVGMAAEPSGTEALPETPISDGGSSLYDVILSSNNTTPQESWSLGSSAQDDSEVDELKVMTRKAQLDPRNFPVPMSPGRSGAEITSAPGDDKVPDSTESSDHSSLYESIASSADMDKGDETVKRAHGPSSSCGIGRKERPPSSTSSEAPTDSGHVQTSSEMDHRDRVPFSEQEGGVHAGLGRTETGASDLERSGTGSDHGAVDRLKRPTRYQGSSNDHLRNGHVHEDSGVHLFDFDHERKGELYPTQTPIDEKTYGPLGQPSTAKFVQHRGAIDEQGPLAEGDGSRKQGTGPFSKDEASQESHVTSDDVLSDNMWISDASAGSRSGPPDEVRDIRYSIPSSVAAQLNMVGMAESIRIAGGEKAAPGTDACKRPSQYPMRGSTSLDVASGEDLLHDPESADKRGIFYYHSCDVILGGNEQVPKKTATRCSVGDENTPCTEGTRVEGMRTERREDSETAALASGVGEVEHFNTSSDEGCGYTRRPSREESVASSLDGRLLETNFPTERKGPPATRGHRTRDHSGEGQADRRREDSSDEPEVDRETCAHLRERNVSFNTKSSVTCDEARGPFEEPNQGSSITVIKWNSEGAHGPSLQDQQALKKRMVLSFPAKEVRDSRESPDLEEKRCSNSNAFADTTSANDRRSHEDTSFEGGSGMHGDEYRFRSEMSAPHPTSASLNSSSDAKPRATQSSEDRRIREDSHMSADGPGMKAIQRGEAAVHRKVDYLLDGVATATLTQGRVCDRRKAAATGKDGLSDQGSFDELFVGEKSRASVSSGSTSVPRDAVSPTSGAGTFDQSKQNVDAGSAEATRRTSHHDVGDNIAPYRPTPRVDGARFLETATTMERVIARAREVECRDLEQAAGDHASLDEHPLDKAHRSSPDKEVLSLAYDDEDPQHGNSVCTGTADSVDWGSYDEFSVGEAPHTSLDSGTIVTAQDRSPVVQVVDVENTQGPLSRVEKHHRNNDASFDELWAHDETAAHAPEINNLDGGQHLGLARDSCSAQNHSLRVERGLDGSALHQEASTVDAGEIGQAARNVGHHRSSLDSILAVAPVSEDLSLAGTSSCHQGQGPSARSGVLRAAPEQRAASSPNDLHDCMWNDVDSSVDHFEADSLAEMSEDRAHLGGVVRACDKQPTSRPLNGTPQSASSHEHPPSGESEPEDGHEKSAIEGMARTTRTAHPSDTCERSDHTTKQQEGNRDGTSLSDCLAPFSYERNVSLDEYLFDQLSLDETRSLGVSLSDTSSYPTHESLGKRGSFDQEDLISNASFGTESGESSDELRAFC